MNGSCAGVSLHYGSETGAVCGQLEDMAKTSSILLAEETHGTPCAFADSGAKWRYYKMDAHNWAAIAPDESPGPSAAGLGKTTDEEARPSVTELRRRRRGDLEATRCGQRVQ